MNDQGDRKSKRSRRDPRRDTDDDGGIIRGSLVDYSKVTDRHVDDDRFEKHRNVGLTPFATSDIGAAAAGVAVGTLKAQQPKLSSQMAALMRVMVGKEERTIAEKLADSNRPTWEQYKKDNEDKLDIAGIDRKKMEAYRKQLDDQREKLLTRGTNHRNEGVERKSKKKKEKKHRRHHDDCYIINSDSSYYSKSDDGRRSHKRKRNKKKSRKHDHKKSSRRYESDSYEIGDNCKKSSKHKRKKDRKRKKGDDGSAGSNSGDSYRLSSFFTKSSDSESVR